MSKPFDYSKWDKIELSDDEEDVHPNIDKESWFRMKHRSRVEREEQEAIEVKGIHAAMEKANQRIQVLQHDLKKLEETLVIQDVGNKQVDDDDDDDDDDEDVLEDAEGIKAELNELLQANEVRNKRLQEIEKNKKWNVDNICEIKEERTIINSNAAKDNYTPTGFAKAKEDLIKEQAEAGALADGVAKKASDTTKTTSTTTTTATASTTSTSAAKPTKIIAAPVKTVAPAAKPVTVPPPPASAEISPAMETYHDFTLKYSEIVEEFMHLESFEASKEYLLKYGDILLQENASNYLLLASLEDEMNGFHTKMKLTCRQSQIISNITELAKSMKTHPGNMVIPFFARLEQRELLMGFMEGVTAFCEKIAARAVTKKAEMDRERMEEEMEQAQKEGTDLEEIPKEERLGPGGLDPLEVIETLPLSMQQAFESRDVEQLKTALLAMDPKDAQYHMKRCVDSGLWCDNS